MTLHLNTVTLRLNNVTLRLNTMALCLNIVALRLNTVTLHLNTVTLGLNTVTLHLNTVTLRLNTMTLRLNTEGLEQEFKHSQDPLSNQDEQEVTLACEDPEGSPSQRLEKSCPASTPESSAFKLSHWNAKMSVEMKEFAADHVDWLERINSIIQKINNTENTVKSLLNEVISLENQSEHLEDSDQEANIEEKIIEIRKQLKDVNIKLAQVDTCNEACELKEKLIERIESFHKEMNALNTKLEVHHSRRRETDSQSSEDLDMEQSETLLPEASPPPSGSHSPPCSAVWKQALKLFAMVYVVTITGLSCYILFVDATFLFERMLPCVLGHGTMWELREMMAPFLNLEAEDLLPS
ncbi:Single-pass membrane and coiled-coil domain-containing protein 2 [Lemmus lemmus]